MKSQDVTLDNNKRTFILHVSIDCLTRFTLSFGAKSALQRSSHHFYLLGMIQREVPPKGYLLLSQLFLFLDGLYKNANKK